MDIKIKPQRLSGTLDAVSSKSFVHRLLICSALSDRETCVYLKPEPKARSNYGLSEDITATVSCLEAMGCNIKTEDSALVVTPLKNPLPPSAALQCGESGSTARFLLPLSARLFNSFTMSGSGKLPNRPFAPLCNALASAGYTFNSDRLPLSGAGKLKAGDFSIEGDISSQFISGLLFTLPLLDGDSRINITTPLQSASYVDMTVEVLSMFGIETEKRESGFNIKGNQQYRSPGTVTAEGDWSNAAFFLCMDALGGNVLIRGLSTQSTQGDKEVVEILRRFGAKTSEDDPGVCRVTAGTLRGINIDASQIPDLIPVLAVVASLATGVTRIFNAQRLRLKESDRIQSTFNMLSALGADLEITEDGLIIHGKKRLRGGTVDNYGDHRIVMAAATAASACENPVVIKDFEAVNKSYPSFFEDFKTIGGAADVFRSGK